VELILKVWLFLFLVLSATLSLSAYSASPTDTPTMYKYLDDKGNVVLSTNLPPAYASKGFSIVDSYGRVIEEIPPAKTKEQIAEDRRREAVRASEQKKLDEQNKADEELLKQFTTLKDIERARENQINSIHVEIELREAAANRSRKQLEENQQMAADLERQGKAIPSIITENITDFQKRIEDANAFIADRKAQQDEVNKKFADDMARFRGLNIQRLQKVNLNRSEQLRAEQYHYNCQDLEDCAKAWQLVQLYVNKNSTTPIQVLTETLIVTQAPTKDTDISLTASKVPDKQMNYTIQLEITCNDSPDGNSVCIGDRVKEIKAGMIRFINTYRNQ